MAGSWKRLIFPTKATEGVVLTLYLTHSLSIINEYELPRDEGEAMTLRQFPTARPEFL